jgi:3'(2'), 5'-bisphosphate nucleotidase
VDPIDGTRGFATKNGQFSVMIGLAVAGRAVLGVVAEPVAGRLTYATHDGGCFTEGDRPARVSGERSPLRLARSHGRAGKPTLGERLLAPCDTITTHSAGIKLALVARGEADVYVNDHAAFCDWDVCAGHVLVEAAGGRVSGFDGTLIGYGPGGPRRTCGLVASNGRVHDEVVGRLAQPIN